MELVRDFERQIKSICVYEYLLLFNEMEKTIRLLFEKDISNWENNSLNELYFYYGSHCKPYIDITNKKLIADPLKYKQQETFSKITTIQIVKFALEHSEILKELKIDISSLRTPMGTFNGLEIIKMLIEMRNKMAHDIIKSDFSKCVIELLPVEYIEAKNYTFFEGYDLKKMDESSRDIMSNYMYMEQILNTLS